MGNTHKCWVVSFQPYVCFYQQVRFYFTPSWEPSWIPSGLVSHCGVSMRAVVSVNSSRHCWCFMRLSLRLSWPQSTQSPSSLSSKRSTSTKFSISSCLVNRCSTTEFQWQVFYRTIISNCLLWLSITRCCVIRVTTPVIITASSDCWALSVMGYVDNVNHVELTLNLALHTLSWWVHFKHGALNTALIRITLKRQGWQTYQRPDD